MDSDASLLLPLLAVRLLGGENVDKTEPAIKAVQSKLFTEAKKRDLLKESKLKVDDPTKPPTKTGKPAMKTVTVYSLTDNGKQFLEQPASPAAQAAERVAMVADLKRQLENDRRELHAAFNELTKRLDRVMDSVQQPASTKDEPSSVTESTGELNVRNQIAAAYRELCHRVEFEDGLIDFSRLYHKAGQELPDLSVERFKETLIHLRDQNGLQLGPINEVHRLSESERALAIAQDDSLLYYAYWPQERP